jgi:hypothetical protein
MFEGKNLDLKKEAEEVLQIKGHERGTDIKYLVKYAKLKKGEDGHRKVVEALRGIGYEMPDTDKIDDMEWIPASMPTLYMLAMFISFNWNEQDLIEMGKKLLSFSPLTKLFVKFFVSPLQTFKTGAKKWNSHYDFGKAEAIEYTDHSVVLRLTNFKKHKITCFYLSGIFTKIIELAVGSKSIKTVERKCIFNGDDSHDFLIRW